MEELSPQNPVSADWWTRKKEFINMFLALAISPFLLFLLLAGSSLSLADSPSHVPTEAPTAMPTAQPTAADPFSLLEEDEVLERIQRRAREIFPSIDTRKCVRSFQDSKLSPKCRFREGETTVERECPRGPPSPRMAWFIHCVARIMLTKHDFQVPVYVVALSEDEPRAVRIREHLQRTEFRNVHFVTEKSISNITEAERDAFFHVIRNRREGGQRSDKEHITCIEILNASYSRGFEYAQWMCNKHGTNKLNVKEKSIVLKNLLIGAQIMRCAQLRENDERVSGATALQHSLFWPNSTQQYFSPSTGSLCPSSASNDALRYVLILEVDQFVASDALQRIAETILQSAVSATDGPVGAFFLCDSFCQSLPMSQYPYLQGTPYSNSYGTTHSKTTASVMLSLSTLRDFYLNNHWLPVRRAMDHWYNYILFKEQVRAQYLFPPITCHGSQGLEDALHRGRTRQNSQHCWESFYDSRTLKPHLVGVSLE